MNFWAFFFLSFAVALTGAISPGPLLTYTISKTLERGRGGWATGLYVCAGHAILEGGILTMLLVGLSFLITQPVVILLIGLVGGVILIVFAAFYFRDVFVKKVSLQLAAEGSGSQQTSNVVLGGALVSMSNPYWWIWWATIGLNLLITNLVDVSTVSGVAAFFLGHETGDVAWYVLVSTLVSLGRKKINDRVYRGILLCCAVFMAVLGLYFMVSVLLVPPS
ncbi:MAG: LysE family transporter [Promethearchaeota archaeon]